MRFSKPALHVFRFSFMAKWQESEQVDQTQNDTTLSPFASWAPIGFGLLFHFIYLRPAAKVVYFVGLW